MFLRIFLGLVFYTFPTLQGYFHKNNLKRFPQLHKKLVSTMFEKPERKNSNQVYIMVQKYIKTAVKRARARHHVSQCFYFTMVCLITKIPPKLLIFNRNSCPGNSTKGPGRKFQKNKHSGEKTLKKSHFTIKRAKRAAFILTNV